MQNACKFLTLYKHTCKYITKNRAALYSDKARCYWEHVEEHIENFEAQVKIHWEQDKSTLGTLCEHIENLKKTHGECPFFLIPSPNENRMYPLGCLLLPFDVY